MPEVFNKVISYQRELILSNNLSNIINGSLFKSFFEIKRDDSSEVLPLVLYFDDVETGNPLGSHSGTYKLGAVYCSLATVPPEYSNRLEDIF